MQHLLAHRRPPGGLTYDDYLDLWRARLDEDLKGLDKAARKLHYYRRYNWDRAAHVRDVYAPSAVLTEAMASIAEPQLWVVLTEDWCGDSAYALPVIEAAARLSEHVTLRILPRDANLELMDEHLTNGARSIPKLIAYNRDGEVLFAWGPRPAEAQALRERLRAGGATPQAVTAALIAWFEADGWQPVDEELAAALRENVQV